MAWFRGGPSSPAAPPSVKIPLPRFLSPRSAQSKPWTPAVVTNDPNPDVLPSNVVEEVIRKPVQIAPSETAPVEVKIPRIVNRLLKTYLQLSKEIISELVRNRIVPLQDLVQIRLHPPMEQCFHGVSDRQQADQK